MRVEIVCRSVEPRATEALCLLVLAGLPVQVQPVEVVPTSAPQVAAPPGEPDPVLACAPLLQVAAPTGERTPRSVRQLLVDGLIFAGDTLYLDQTGASRLAVVLPDGRLRLDDGKEIGEPDDVTGPLSLARPDAWSDWRVEGPLGPRLSDLWTRRERLAHSTSRVGNAG